MLKPRIFIPMHVNTFEFIQQDIADLPAKVRKPILFKPLTIS
jgi:L-ascorbate metabolism protein UlaG (beta-lactamase superfamily)